MKKKKPAKPEPEKKSVGRPRERSRLTPLGDFLVASRAAAGLTQQQVADAMGVVPSRVADMETGRRELVRAYLRQREALERTAAAYGVTVEALLAADTPR